jgi:hypothetical protein
MKTILLLICSNIFMTIAWYGHLKYRKAPLLAAIVVSWLIAFAEYCFQVPANRFGHGFSTEDHPGSDYSLRVHRFCVVVSRRRRQMEPCGFVPVFGGRRDVCVLGKTIEAA